HPANHARIPFQGVLQPHGVGHEDEFRINDERPTIRDVSHLRYVIAIGTPVEFPRGLLAGADGEGVLDDILALSENVGDLIKVIALNRHHADVHAHESLPVGDEAKRTRSTAARAPRRTELAFGLTSLSPPKSRRSAYHRGE